MAQTTQKKRYTFLDVSKVSKTGADGKQKEVNQIVVRGYLSLGTKGGLSTVQIQATGETKEVFKASMAISNRAKSLNRVLGTNLPTAEGEGSEEVWVDVTAWGNTASRLAKVMGDQKAIQVIIVGTVNVGDTYTKKNGEQGQNINVTVNQFDVIYGQRSASGQASTANSGTGNNGFAAGADDLKSDLQSISDDFAELVDDDGDVPF